MPVSLYSIALSRMWSSEGQESPSASIVSKMFFSSCYSSCSSLDSVLICSSCCDVLVAAPTVMFSESIPR